MSDCYPDEAPNTGRASLTQLLRQHAQTFPNKVAVRFLERGEVEGNCLTYEALDHQARALAAHLVERGAKGQPVLLVYPAGLAFIIGFCACLYAGAIAVPMPFITPSRSAPRVTAIAADARPHLILTCAALAKDQTLRGVFLADLSGIPWIATDQQDFEDARSWLPPVIQPEDPAFLQYTSGSTAAPRGVIVTHGGLLANLEMIKIAFGHSTETRMVSWLPLFHDMGLVGGLLQPLYLGGLAVLIAPMDFIQRPLRWLQAIARYGGTTSGGPNFAYAMCAERIRPDQLSGLDLRSWRVAFCGAEPVRSEDLRRFAESLASTGFDSKALFPCYGLAEATLFVSGGPVGSGLRCISTQPPTTQAGETERTICGQGAEGQLLAIVDPNSRRRLPEGQVGEIWVSGGHVGAGYWRQGEKSEATFRARLNDGTDSTTFLRTGDLGLMRGRDLVVVGRMKEVIIVRGVKHHPEDIEAAACRAHPALAMTAAAFAIHCDGLEELIVLQEVKRDHIVDADLHHAAQAVQAAICEGFGVRPSDVVLVRPGTLARTTSNKIRRSACREIYLTGELVPFRLDATSPCLSPVEINGGRTDG